MSTLSHDDKTPEQPVGGDKIFLRDISDSGTGVNDGIIVSTVDQLGQTIVNDRSAEIKTSYESNADTNAFTDAEQTKLAGVETGATADQTGAEIKAAYEAEADTNAFTDAEQTKLAGIAAGAEVNPDVVPQAEAEAGTATTERIWTAERVAQAIAALGGGGGGSLTEGNLRAVIASLTAAAPDTADTFGYVDAGSPGQMGQATAQQIVEQGNSDLGIVPQNRISTSGDPGADDDGAGTNGINHLVNDLWTNTTDDTSWICVDTTTSAAVWKPIALTKTGTAAPAVAPDFVGQLFLDTTNENIYIGIDTVNAADFLQVNGGGAGGDLWSDVVDADIVPDADGTRDLGADATRFAQAYIDELHSTGGLLVTESADHTNTPAAGKGEFWVRNDSPCVPVFTDDAGTDHVLNAGGGGGAPENLVVRFSDGVNPVNAFQGSGTAKLLEDAAVYKYDLSNYTQARLRCYKDDADPGYKFGVRYKTGNPTLTLGDYGVMGATSTEIELAAATAGYHESSWFDLDASAQAEVSFAFVGLDITAPANASVHYYEIEFRQN
jgi:hypothetical protein